MNQGIRGGRQEGVYIEATPHHCGPSMFSAVGSLWRLGCVGLGAERQGKEFSKATWGPA